VLVQELTDQLARRETVRDEQALGLASAVLSSEPVRLASMVLAGPPECRPSQLLELLAALDGRLR
jgi:hypothetical protein